MLVYVSRRLVRLVVVCLGASFLTFLGIAAVPGNAAYALLGESATPELVAKVQDQLGLNEPLFVRYYHWVDSLLHGDMGQSLLLHVPVSTLLIDRLPVSAELVGLSTALAIVLGVGLAGACAWREGGAVDRLVNGAVGFGLGFPNFVLALLGIIVLAVKLQWLPATGYVSVSDSVGGNLRSMALPALVLAAHTTCLYTRVLRRTMLDVLREPFVETATAKGVSRARLLGRHVLRNSLTGLVTIVGVNIGFQLSGTVILEAIFGLPGLGQLLVNSVLNRDFTVVQGIVVLVAFSYVAINIVVESLYPILDPRVRTHG